MENFSRKISIKIKVELYPLFRIFWGLWWFILSLQFAGNKIKRLLVGTDVDRDSWDYEAKGLQKETKLLKRSLLV